MHELSKTRYMAIVLIGTLTFLSPIALRNPAHADGFHLPNFYENTVTESWKKLKTMFQFPELPKGKTWSDGYAIDLPDNKTRSYQTLRKNSPLPTVLKASIRKLIAILKYTDAYNFAYDSPPWMRTFERREDSVKEAIVILNELGYQALPYLWEELESDLRFTNHPRKAGIEAYRGAQQCQAMVLENLHDTMRAKEAKFSEIEREILKIVSEFWKQDSIIGSAAAKLDARYSKLLGDMEILIRNHEQKDERIKKLVEELKKAETAAKEALGKCPGEYTAYQGGFRVSDNFQARLREAIVQYGKHAKTFLLPMLGHVNPEVRKAAKQLIAAIEEKEAKAGAAVKANEKAGQKENGLKNNGKAGEEKDPSKKEAPSQKAPVKPDSSEPSADVTIKKK